MRKYFVFLLVAALVFVTMSARAVNISTDLGMYYYSDKIPVTQGNYYFVCSAGSSDGAGSDSYEGTSPRQPLATIDAAINKCTAASSTYPGDVIVVLPRHNEDLDAATDLVPDTAGIYIIGLGEGENRPHIDFTGTSGSILISGIGTTFDNFIFENQLDNIAECIDVGADDVTIKNCVFRDAAGTSGKIFIMLDGANTADRFKCYDTTFTFLSGTENGDVGIEIDDAQDGVELVRLRFTGDYDESCIQSDAANTNAYIYDIVAENTVADQFAIEFTSTTTGFMDKILVYTDDMATAIDPGSLKLGYDVYFSAGIDRTPQRFPSGGTIAGADAILLKLTAAGDTTSIIDESLCSFPNDYFNYGWIAHFTDADGTGETVDISDFAAATGDLTVGTLGASPAAGDHALLQYNPLLSVCEDTSDAVDMGTEIPDDSVLANILAIDGDVVDYDRRYDSLEALGDDTDAIIADFTDYALDNLAAVADGSGAYPASVVNDSILAMILGDDDPASAATYNNTTDSLEAISNALAAGTGCTAAIDADNLDHLASTSTGIAADADLTSLIVDQSILSHVMTDGADTSEYLASTDSLEALGTKTFYITKVATCTTTAAASTDNMFDVGGPIMITSLWGVCTTAASGSPGDMTIEYDATTGADYDSDFSTTVTVDTLGAGDTIHFSNAIDEGVLTITANVSAGQPLSWIAGDPAGGVIEQTLTSTGTMAITWYMTYIPLTATSTVAAST